MPPQALIQRPTEKVCLIVLFHCVEEQAGKMTFWSLDRVVAYFGFVTLLVSVVEHKHLFLALILTSIWTRLRSEEYRLLCCLSFCTFNLPFTKSTETVWQLSDYKTNAVILLTTLQRGCLLDHTVQPSPSPKGFKDLHCLEGVFSSVVYYSLLMHTGFPLISYLLCYKLTLICFVQRQQFWVKQQSADRRGTCLPVTPDCYHILHTSPLRTCQWKLFNYSISGWWDRKVFWRLKRSDFASF